MRASQANASSQAANGYAAAKAPAAKARVLRRPSPVRYSDLFGST
jgi:hypothetical protein